MSYKKSKYFITQSNKKIKYLLIKKKSQISVVFFHGFMSDMIGAKPMAIQKFCKSNKLSFLKFEYSGHGKSTGKFTDGNISAWSQEAKQLIKKKIKNTNKLIFIGSSMGSWIALNLFPYFKKQLKGFIGISSAPEFLENLMWKKFSKKIKKIILKEKMYNVKNGKFIYPITKQLIFDGRKNKIISSKINIKILIQLLHGTKDEVVPISYSRKILKIFKKGEGKLIKVKNGKHNLSRKMDLKKICSSLNFILRKIPTI